MDGIHIGRRSGCTQNDAAGVGHKEAFVDLQHTEFVSIRILATDVFGAREVDIRLVEQDDTATLQSGQRTRGLRQLACWVATRIARAIVPDDDFTALGT